jgi:hypothetical protein
MDRQQGVSMNPNVRFGSLAATAWSNGDVRFTPNSCRDCQSPARPLWAKSRLMQCSKYRLLGQMLTAQTGDDYDKLANQN